MSELQRLQEERAALEARIRSLEQQQPPTAHTAHTAHTAPTPQPPEEPVQPPPPTPAMVEALYDHAGAEFFDESAGGAHATAYGLLSTLLLNIAQWPGEPKYRRVKLSNARLQRDLFSDPGALPFLRHLGFETDPATAGPTSRPEDETLVFARDGPQALQQLRAAHAAVELLQRRDATAVESQQAFAAFRQSVAYEIRMERLQQALGSGQLVEATCANLLWNDTGSIDEVTLLLRRIAGNILADPCNPKFRFLRHNNRKLREVVFPASGAVEFLLGVLGFEWRDDGLLLPMDRYDNGAGPEADEDGAAPPCPLAAGGPTDTVELEAVFDPSARLAARRAEASAAGEDPARARLLLRDVVANAVKLLDVVDAKAKAKLAAEREASKAEWLAERNRERRAMLRPQAQARAPAPAADDDDDDDDGARPVSSQGRRRIPIAEAMQRLLGRDLDA